MSVPKKVRLDKWLWSVRMYKTRSFATAACRSGRVKVNDQNAKPSYALSVGEIVRIRKKDKVFILKVEKLIEKRVGAAAANSCYEDRTPPPTPDDRMRAFFYRTGEQREKGSGRPTKKERRTLDGFKGDS